MMCSRLIIADRGKCQISRWSISGTQRTINSRNNAFLHEVGRSSLPSGQWDIAVAGILAALFPSSTDDQFRLSHVKWSCSTVIFYWEWSQTPSDHSSAPVYNQLRSTWFSYFFRWVFCPRNPSKFIGIKREQLGSCQVISVVFSGVVP